MKKIFKVQTEDETSVFGISVMGGELEVVHLAKKAPYFEWVLKVLIEKFGEEIEAILRGYNRQNRFKVSRRIGMSGCEDYFVEWVENHGPFHKFKKRHVLHISMEGKINEGISAFIPDFFEVVGEYFSPDLIKDLGIEVSEIPEIPMGEDYKPPWEAKATKVFEELVESAKEGGEARSMLGSGQ